MCLVLVTTCTYVVQRAWFGDLDSAGDRPAVTLMRWMVASLVVVTAIVPTLGAALAPSAIPAKHELQSVQSEALAGISGSAMVTGRLIACLRPLWLILLISAVLWTGVELHFSPLAYGTWVNVLEAHFVILCELYAIAGISVLASANIQGGRSWIRGPLVALLTHIASILGLFLMNGWLVASHNPVPLIRRLLLVNPITAVCTCLNFDLLRVNWVYGRTTAPEFDFKYPAPLASASVFMALALVSALAAGWVVGRSART